MPTNSDLKRLYKDAYKGKDNSPFGFARYDENGKLPRDADVVTAEDVYDVVQGDETLSITLDEQNNKVLFSADGGAKAVVITLSGTSGVLTDEQFTVLNTSDFAKIQRNGKIYEKADEQTLVTVFECVDRVANTVKVEQITIDVDATSETYKHWGTSTKQILPVATSDIDVGSGNLGKFLKVGTTGAMWGDAPEGGVTSVNAKTGAVTLAASDIYASNAQTIQQNLARIDTRIDDFVDDNIEGSDTIIVDLDEDNEKYQIRLDNDYKTKVDNALVIPTSAPTDDILVGISTSKDQEQIYIGDGLELTSTEGGSILNVDIVDNVTSSSATSVLSAKQGKLLNERVNNIEGRGRFLSVWNATTGKPADLPLDISTTTYTYRTGDYFIVGTAGNKVPTGTFIAAGTTISTFPSATGATSSVNDTIVYNGATWDLIHYTSPTVTFSSITGQPSDNANLASVLGGKLDATKSAVSTVGGLVIPTPTLTSSVLVAISSNKDQLNVSLGDQLNLANGSGNDKVAQVTGVLMNNNNTLKFWTGTQAQYDAIVTKDANTLYIVKEN